MRIGNRSTTLNSGQVLRAEGLLTPEQLDDVLRDAQETGERIADVVLARGLATEYDLAKALVRQLSLPYLSPKSYDAPKEALAALPATIVHQRRVLPLDVFGDVLLIATYCELEPQAVAELEADTGKRLACVISLKSDLEAALNDRYPPQDLGKEVASRLDQLFGE
jgi:hypothetical protein